MGHNSGYRRDEQYAEALEALRNARAIDDATRVIVEFNIRLERRLPLLFTPTIGAALISKHPWLQIHCAGCDVISDIDLRVVRRDPEMPITQILHSLACQRCRGQGPTPRLMKLTRLPRSD